MWVALFALCFAFAPLVVRAGNPVADSVDVHVDVKVTSFAEAALPYGNTITFDIPPTCRALRGWFSRGQLRLCRIYDRWTQRAGGYAQLPFVITGNAKVSVAVTPDASISVADGRSLGEARRWDGASLGYDTAVRFPILSPRFGIGTLSPAFGRLRFGVQDPYWGALGATTTPIAVSLAEHRNRALGVIQTWSRRNWTISGEPARAGLYRGTLVLTITAE